MSSPQRFLIVGDVHGCSGELAALLDAVAPTGGDTICFLGDYIDRGPDSRGVIDRLIDLRRQGPRCHFLRGNHEDMFLAYLGLDGRYADAFVANGGYATLASYGIERLAGERARAALPPGHEEFLRSLEWTVRRDRFLCVHAGLDPRRDAEHQDPEDLLWIRGEFISARLPFPFVVVFGHTPFREVAWNLHRKIGLDTGLVYGGKLSCLDLVSATLWQVRRGQSRAEAQDVRAHLDAHLRDLDTTAASH